MFSPISPLLQVNAEYLAEQAVKVKREEEEREEAIRQGRDPDKKKKAYRSLKWRKKYWRDKYIIDRRKKKK